MLNFIPKEQIYTVVMRIIKAIIKELFGKKRS